MTDAPPLLVIGAGGLLGRHVVRTAPSAVAPPIPIPWADPTDALGQAARWLGRQADGGPWRAAWCAGASVVGSSPETLAAERRSLEHFLGALAASCSSTGGAFLCASSAGGVHAGTTDDPVTEHSSAVPMSAYGEAKLEQEGVVRAWSAATGVPAVVARLSNLYGPGQNPAKPQGLVSRLVRASLRADPLLLYVSLDTVRDYLFVTDAARKVSLLLERAAGQEGTVANRVPVKLVCSGQTTTVGQIVAEVHRIRRRRPPVVFGATQVTALQPQTLRFRSEVWTDLDHGSTVSLPEGIAAVIRDQLRLLSAGASV